jgi:hypothetical protein
VPPGNEFESADVPGFAPDEPTDDRPLGDWKTRYSDPSAIRAIRLESTYVWVAFSFAVIAILAVSVQSAYRIVPTDKSGWESISPFLLAFLGGVLGGTLFAMKWLYHSVAKGLWNRDRRLWRLFTPALSGGAGLTIILLCASGVIPLFGPTLVHTNAGALGLSVVFGYFSDRAFSSLERLAEDNLGPFKRKNGRKD